jgi:hypothetical protein
MTPWRELAIQHLPNLREVILAAESHVDLWQCFKELLAEAGVSESRRQEAESIYSYAWWCLAESGDQELSVAVETYFYEDLPVYSDFEEQIPVFIKPSQFQRMERAFAYRLSDEEFEDFRSRFVAATTGSGAGQGGEGR